MQIVDLTRPLQEPPPLIKLPPPFVNMPGLSREEISHYHDRGPAWAWYTLTIGEHVGTRLDAPIHWITGKDGALYVLHSPRSCEVAMRVSVIATGNHYLFGVPAALLVAAVAYASGSPGRSEATFQRGPVRAPSKTSSSASTSIPAGLASAVLSAEGAHEHQRRPLRLFRETGSSESVRSGPKSLVPGAARNRAQR